MKDFWLLDALWEGREEVIKHGLPRDQVSTGWQLLLLGDGSPTKHLQLLTGEPTQVEVLDMSPIGLEFGKAPYLVHQVPGPRLRRQVWLKTASGQKLAYAVSWWQEQQVNNYLKDTSVPVWVSLTSTRMELYRDIQCIQYGHCKSLEKHFNHPGPFWARQYFFWYQGKPLTLIYEVFSPFLDKYLGKASLDLPRTSSL